MDTHNQRWRAILSPQTKRYFKYRAVCPNLGKKKHVENCVICPNLEIEPILLLRQRQFRQATESVNLNHRLERGNLVERNNRNRERRVGRRKYNLNERSMADSMKEEETNSGDVQNPEEDVSGMEVALESGGSPKANSDAAESHVAEEKKLTDVNEESSLLPDVGKPIETGNQNPEEPKLEEESSISPGKAAEESLAEKDRPKAEDENVAAVEQVVEEAAGGIKEDSPISETNSAEATAIATGAEATQIAEEIANEEAVFSEQTSKKDAFVAEEMVIEAAVVADQTTEKVVCMAEETVRAELGVMEDNNAGENSIPEEQSAEETCISEEKVAHEAEEESDEKLTEKAGDADKMIADDEVGEEACIAKDKPAKEANVAEDNPSYEEKTAVTTLIEDIDSETAVQKVATELTGLEEQGVGKSYFGS